MTSQGHLTTISLKQATKEFNIGSFLSTFILETSHSKLRDPKQYDFDHDQTNNRRFINKSLACKRMLVSPKILLR